MSQNDALQVLDAIVKSGNSTIAAATITPAKVGLHQSLRGIAETKNPDLADGFAVHSPNEVFELFWPA